MNRTPLGDTSAATAVVLPGTGSDDVFVRAVFEQPLDGIGVRLIAPAPMAGAPLVASYLEAFDAVAASTAEPILVGGVSFGAHLATTWALRNQARCAGVLVALPAWNGPAGDAPAALAARASAALVRQHGLEGALQLAVSGITPWLADELRRAWRRHGDQLADGLETAAAYPAPELPALGTLDVPVGIAACTDDDIHPAEVACAWADALPYAAVQDTTLAEVGADPANLGRATVTAYRRARAAALRA